MAINPLLKYVGRITAATLDYPFGSSKNETSPGAGDGTPYEIARANDVFGFQQALLESAGIAPSNNAETALISEYMQALVEIAQGRAINYNDVGVADAYVLDAQSKQQTARSFFDGQIFKFIAGFTSTGASTCNPVALGVLAIKLRGGVIDTIAGSITTGQESTLIYRSSPTPHLELQQNNDVATGTLTVPQGGGSSSNDNIILHGLGTDDVDFGGTFSHTGGTVDTAFTQCTMQGVDNRIVNLADLALGFANSPASGQLFAHFSTTGSTGANYVLNWWARAR